MTFACIGVSIYSYILSNKLLMQPSTVTFTDIKQAVLYKQNENYKNKFLTKQFLNKLCFTMLFMFLISIKKLLKSHHHLLSGIRP